MTCHSVMWIREQLQDVRYLDYQFVVHEGIQGLYLQANFPEADIVTGKVEQQFTRKWKLSNYMTKSEIIQTAFKCALTSAEHRCREHFRYKGSAVYSPHYDVDELEQLCKRKAFDYRESL
jgi:hypothetical protein